MIIDRDTKLSDILAAYPYVKEKLPEINERFSMIRSPIAKVILKTATIADMSLRSGMDEGLLIREIQRVLEA